jgi:TonB-linked SusC/RagA family outer membrane protein
MQKFIYVLVSLLLFGNLAFSQQQTITGVVKAPDGSTLPGVNVSIKGTTTGTVTDIDGRYTLPVQSGSVVLFSYIGYQPQEIKVTGSSAIDVTLQETSQELKEVVITALGVERKTKSLGYSVQELGGDEMAKARESNVINSLNAKVAGVTIVGTPSGVGSSSRITIRGERSLNMNKNQPLFVVDGVPVSNEYNGSSGRNNQEVDYGNPAGMINPEDIESMTVLKGANAAALYGSRAANGVIVITTKSGQRKKALGVSFSTSIMFESVLRLPDYQNKYGQGLDGKFSFVDGNGGGLRDGTDESWGPELDHIITESDLDADGNMFGVPQTVGQMLVLPQFDSPRSVAGYRGGDVSSPGAAGSTITPTRWDSNPDNIKDFFETGYIRTYSLALDGANDQGNFRVSYTRSDEKGTIPNTGLSKNIIAFNGGYNLSSKLSSKVTLNYVNQKSDNRPNLSYGTENIMYLFNCWLDRGIDLNSLKDYWQKGLEGTQQYNFNYNYHDNPYFQLYENTNGQHLDRIYGNVSIKYDFTDWLYLQFRAGTDYSNDLRDRRRAFSTQRFKYGSYREEKITFQENNLDVLLGMNKLITPKWNVNVIIGANSMNQNNKYLDVMAPQLLVPDVYSLNNSRVALSYSQSNTEKQIYSVFSAAQLAYNDYWFIDITARNDWSSTLPEKNNSYFYPSISSSLVVSDAFKLPAWLSYTKIRAGIAQVGNDTDPYQLTQPYNSAGSFGDSYTYSESSVLNNPNLKPEISTSTEVGIDLKFFSNRIGLSASYYYTMSRNQILQVPITIASGYSAKVLNAGKIKNDGLELSLNLIPVKLASFQWDIDVNWSKNNSEIVELADDISTYVMATKYVTVEAREGGRMGDMYGYGFQRSPDGEILYSANGRPKQSSDKILLGNYNPDWLCGINNTFRYKNISMNILFDIRSGGNVYSHTMVVGREGGQLIETLEGRANGYDLSVEGNGVIGKGVVEVTDADGTVTGYTPNTTKLSAREWNTAFTNGRALLEGAVFDASFVKLREIKIGYSIPNKVFGKMPLHDVNFSLVGRNLFLWTNVPHIDPETSGLSGGTIVPGVEAMSMPSSRTYGFSLSLKL